MIDFGFEALTREQLVDVINTQESLIEALERSLNSCQYLVRTLTGKVRNNG